MSFYVVAREREDGDYDSVAAFQYADDGLEIPAAEWAVQVFEHCEDLHPEDSFRIIRLENVEDVISQELWSGDDAPACISDELKDMLSVSHFPSDALTPGGVI